jgi:pimeloyl-ACP methyl ester carboxylesterase
MALRFQADLVPTRFVDGPLERAVRVPAVRSLRDHPAVRAPPALRGTIDHWDPTFLDALAGEREVIIFDNRGLNGSSGTPATSVSELVDGTIAFVRALRLSQVDLLGWSLGGIVAQGVALTAPGLA